MQKYTTLQRTKIVQFYFENGRSITQTQLAYKRYFQVRKAPIYRTIMKIIERFQEQGAVRDLPRPGRQRSVVTEANRQRVSDNIESSPGTSTRRRSTQLGMSRRSLQRILKDLKLFPYKIQIVQALKPTDYQRRLEFAVRFQTKAAEDPEFIHNLIMSDEAHFHLNGFVNKQNCRIWAKENPRVIHERQLHPLKCTVWCGVTADRVIGPYFFENEDGNSITVDGTRYRAMINNFLRPAVENHPQIWFQQDGATPHTAGTISENRIISRNSDFPWPPCSPELSAPDFFLWAYLKERVYVNKPRTIQQLKNNITQEIQALGANVLRSVMENALERARLCEAGNGQHLRDVIFHV
uniref:DUF4817 domain-containing protein n=2 Tax=Cacopsylla melanoneura TaxID=428564 RepID=A0A8D8SNF8_9HEMI